MYYAFMENKQILLNSRPAGLPTTDNFRIEDVEILQPKEGEVLVRTLYLSVDPYMRSRMNDRKSYVPPFALNEVIVGAAVGEVMESRAADFKTGDIVTGMLGWRLYSTARAEELHKVDPNLAPVTTALGVLGMPGLTAYFGLLDICDPKRWRNCCRFRRCGSGRAHGLPDCQDQRLPRRGHRRK